MNLKSFSGKDQLLMFTREIFIFYRNFKASIKCISFFHKLYRPGPSHCHFTQTTEPLRQCAPNFVINAAVHVLADPDTLLPHCLHFQIKIMILHPFSRQLHHQTVKKRKKKLPQGSTLPTQVQ